MIIENECIKKVQVRQLKKAAGEVLGENICTCTKEACALCVIRKAHDGQRTTREGSAGFNIPLNINSGLVPNYDTRRMVGKWGGHSAW